MTERPDMFVLGIKSRSDRAKPLAGALVDWFTSQGIPPSEAVDLCLFAVGYITEIKLGEPNPIDIIGMISAGQVEAKLDKRSQEEHS